MRDGTTRLLQNRAHVWHRRNQNCSTTLSRAIQRSSRSPDFHHHRCRRGAGRTADADRLVALLHPSLALLGLLGVAVSWLFWEGIGVWGLNVPVGWAWDITNFVFWIGIGHAGTLISAILFLFRQKWRTSINRAAEAMTIFAVMCALLFPGIHVDASGSPTGCSRSRTRWACGPISEPLLWDVFAVSVGTVSVLFWYVGLIPDLATMRDRAKTRPGGSPTASSPSDGGAPCGNGTTTRRLSRPRSPRRWFSPFIRSSRWISRSPSSPVAHDDLPAYFVAGAIFSGFAMVLTLMVICRQAFGLEHIVTLRHFDYMAKIMLVTGSMVGFAYATEFFTAW